MDSMYKTWMRHFVIWVASALAAGACPFSLKAQLVRNATPSQAQITGSQQTAAPAATTPAGKPRLSQEIQLTGDQLWTDTGIIVQPGEHVIATATGKVHYADAADDAGPAGLTRGFRTSFVSFPTTLQGAAQSSVVSETPPPRSLF
jgi:hypothetical protein